MSEQKTAIVDENANRDPQTYAIIGAAMAVHTTLGKGYLERVYQDALEHEFADRKLPFQREQPITIYYKGCPLSTPYRADFVCFDTVIVEIKAIKQLSEIEDAQVLNYLKATGFARAMLFNFATKQLEYRRFANDGRWIPR